MKTRFLGSGGWVPTDVRETCSVLVRDGNEALVIDAGTGIRRLVSEPGLLAGVRRIHIVLTHFHLDHTMGLPFLPALDVEAEVWGAGVVIAGSPTEQLLHRLLDPPFMLDEPADLTELFASVNELEEGRADVGPFRLDARLQPLHAGPTVALKLNGEIAYCTDTAYDEDNVAFVRGARVLAHEAFHASDETDDPRHTAAGEAARLAAAAGVERLVLIHTHPLLRDDEELLRHARPHFERVEVASDGLVV